MITLKTFFLLTIISTLGFVSCNKMTPAGFWKSYRKNLLVKNISDQGPKGGYSAIYWKTDRGNTFSSRDFLEFAKENGWTLIDSSAFSQAQTDKWTYDNRSVFPLTSTGFSDTVLNDEELKHFPRWFGGQLNVYKFKTGWVTIEPGTDNSIEENGFVVINGDKTEMAIYHLWGD
jgi:hypothetical protein